MTDLADDDDLSELLDCDFPRVDLVGRPASGVPRFLIAKQDADAPGLLDPEFVRTLIGKQAEPEAAAPERVTMTGSPAAMAEMLARVRKGTQDEDVAKAEMSSRSVNDLPDSAFAFIESGGKKDADGKTTPRSLRHFPIHDAAHVRNALARLSSSPFGDKAAGKVKAAARKFGIEVSKEAGVPDTVTKDMGPELDDGIDKLDPTVPLCEPDEMGAGDPADPGSPAWESIDAATAQKWCSILSRAKVAVGLLSEREMLEAAAGDSDDGEKAWDLQDACCAIDFAISVLAPFAVAEQSAADCGEDELMAAVGKSAADAGAVTAVRKAMGSADLTGPLMTLETFGSIVRKSGRVLSSVNETHIREAASRLNTVLSSLPQAPTADDGQPVAKMTPAEEAGMPEATPSETVTAESGQAPAMGTGEAPMAAREAVVAKVAEGGLDAPQDAPEGAAPVAKADGGDGGKPAQVAVYDADGNLVGVANPDDITPLANVKASPKADGGEEVAAEPPADPADMTPQPPADAGTPADAVDDDGTVAKSSDSGVYAVLESIVAKAVAAAFDGRTPAEDIAKQADVAGLLTEVETLKARLATVEEQPAAPKVFTNGAVPPPHQMRGQDQGTAQPVDVAKALELKHELYTADAPRQKQIADDMQRMAIDQLAAIRRG